MRRVQTASPNQEGAPSLGRLSVSALGPGLEGALRWAGSRAARLSATLAKVPAAILGEQMCIYTRTYRQRRRAVRAAAGSYADTACLDRALLARASRRDVRRDPSAAKGPFPGRGSHAVSSDLAARRSRSRRRPGADVAPL